MDLLKGIGSKIAMGLVALGVLAGGVSWWQADPATRHALVSAAGRLGGWTAGVLCLPWVLFAVIGWVAAMDSNRTGAVLVLALTAFEGAALAWLFDFAVHGHAAWALFAASVLLAGVYNLFSCDWIAERVSGP